MFMLREPKTARSYTILLAYHKILFNVCNAVYIKLCWLCTLSHRYIFIDIFQSPHQEHRIELLDVAYQLSDLQS